MILNIIEIGLGYSGEKERWLLLLTNATTSTISVYSTGQRLRATEQRYQNMLISRSDI